MEVVNVSSLPDETSCRARRERRAKKTLTRWLWEHRIFGPQGLVGWKIRIGL
jgi:hypothetical protein